MERSGVVPPEKENRSSESPAPKARAASNRLVKSEATGRVKSVFTIIGILTPVIVALASGIWFFIHREHLPKANIAHEVTYRQLTKDIKWVHVSVNITNVGQPLLDIKSGVVRIQQILPLDPIIANQLAVGMDPIPAEDCVIPWPLRSVHHLKNLVLQIEPGETDTKEYEFLVPASVQTAKIYSEFKNETEPHLKWIKTTIVDLKEKKEKGE
jgi:hypothetical protein